MALFAFGKISDVIKVRLFKKTIKATSFYPKRSDLTSCAFKIAFRNASSRGDFQ